MAQSMSGPARWAFLLGVGGAAAFVLGPLLAHFGVLPAMIGFVAFGAGGLLGLIALALGIVTAARGGVRSAAGGLVLGGLVSIVFLALAVPAMIIPSMSDVTTDTANAPEFLRAPTLAGNQGRNMRYPGAAFADRQRAAYPDIAPLRLAVPLDEAFLRAVAAATKQMPDWEVTRVDQIPHQFEAVATSSIFRFQDDLIVELRPEGDGSLVQMRSKSRHGMADLGANATRIKAFFGKLQ